MIRGMYLSGGFTPPEGADLSPKHTHGRTDPVYAVHARKLPTAPRRDEL